MITERMQKNIIYRMFIAEEEFADLDISRWSEPWRSIVLNAIYEEEHRWQIIGSTPLQRAVAAAANLYGGRPEDILAAIDAAAQPPSFPSLHDIAADLPPVRWLWPNWIPRGMLSILGAFQGTGKSWFVLDLARAIIHGQPWPDGAPADAPAPILYLDAEGIPQVLNERAVSLDLDRRHLYLLMAEPGEVFDLTKAIFRDRLIDAADTLRPALVIVDSLSSISSAGQNSVEEINQVTTFLTGLARHADCGMLLIHHLRKPSGGQMYLPGLSIHDFRGSGHITAMARTVLGLSVVQTNGKQFTLNGPRRLDLVKTNLGPYPDPLGIQLALEAGRTRFIYGEAPDFERRETAAQSVSDWLLAYLDEHGPTRPADLIAAGEELGFTRPTIYRTRKELNNRIVNTHGYRSPRNAWALPHQIPAETDAETAEETDAETDQ